MADATMSATTYELVDFIVVQLLSPGEHAQAHRHTSSAAFHVVEGSGYSVVAGQRLDWEDKDVFCVPGWTFHEHVNTGDRPAILFSHTHVPAMRSLDLYREEAHPEGRQ